MAQAPKDKAMSSATLFSAGNHRNLLLPDFSDGHAVQANQHLIIHGEEAMILDPGGHKIYSRLLSETLAQLGKTRLRYIFLSHQDPDIVAAINGWLMTTEADAWASNLWLRFIPHFGLDRLLAERLKGIPDEGMRISLGGSPLVFLPAHFLHSPGNFQVYDPVSKILYSGDLGASVEVPYVEVPDFPQHVQYMEGFHRRYMTSQRAMLGWARMVSQLDIELIAPQHGAFFRGKPMVREFINWCAQLPCGVDVMGDIYKVPA